MAIQWDSVAVGAVAGAVSGFASGFFSKVFSDWVADWRKSRSEGQAKEKVFAACEKQMPELLDRMRTDLKAYPLARAVYAVFGDKGKPQAIKGFVVGGFFYYYSEYESLVLKLELLQSNGFLVAGEPMEEPHRSYRMTEEFAEMLHGGSYGEPKR